MHFGHSFRFSGYVLISRHGTAGDADRLRLQPQEDPVGGIGDAGVRLDLWSHGQQLPLVLNRRTHGACASNSHVAAAAVEEAVLHGWPPRRLDDLVQVVSGANPQSELKNPAQTCRSGLPKTRERPSAGVVAGLAWKTRKSGRPSKGLRLRRFEPLDDLVEECRRPHIKRPLVADKGGHFRASFVYVQLVDARA